VNVATWNVLHDGVIRSISGTVPGTIQLAIEISYLYSYLPTKPEHIIIELHDCERFEYQPFEGKAICEFETLAEIGLGIVSAELESNDICVCCSDGSYGYDGLLWTRYSTAIVKTNEGILLTQPELETAAHQYWENWSRRS
jgi:hypothetical protein